MAIKAVLFDKDGTLIDFNATFGPATEKVIRTLSKGDEDRFRSMARVAKFDSESHSIAADSILLAGSLKDIGEGWTEFNPHETLEMFVAEIDELYILHSRESLAVFPFTEGVLDALDAAGLPFGIGTNDSEEAAISHMTHLSLEKRFSRILGFDSGYGAKPGPGMINAFAEGLGMDADAVAMVGDTSHDLEAGRAAGALCIGVASGRWSQEDLAPFADHTLPSIETLPALLAELNRSTA